MDTNDLIKEPIIEFIDIEPLRDGISRCTVKVFHTGVNANKTYISKILGNHIANSLPGRPIVGYYNTEKEQFEGHKKEQYINIDSNNQLSIEFKYLTVPFGYVSDFDPIYWETFEEDGEEKEYLVCTAYLWTGRYPEANQIFESKQSMEFDPKSFKGNWAKIDNYDGPIFIIDEANISALCVLGEGHYPCFKGSEFSPEYEDSSLDIEYNKLKNKVQEIMNENKGGKSEMEINDSNMNNEVLEEETPSITSDNVEETVEDFEVIEETTVVETENEDSTIEETVEVEETTSEEEIVEESDENEETESFDSLKQQLEELTSAYEALKKQSEETTTAFNALKSDYETIVENQKTLENNKKIELMDSFEFLGEEILTPLKEQIENYSLEDLDEKLSALAYKKNVNKTDFESNETITTPYTPVEKKIPDWLKASIDREKR